MDLIRSGCKSGIYWLIPSKQMKNLVLALLAVVLLVTASFADDPIFVDFINFPSAPFESNACTYTLNGVKFEVLDPYSPPYPAQVCTPPLSQEWVFSARFDRCDIPLSTFPGALAIDAWGGCIDVNIRVDYTDGSFEESINLLSAEETLKEIQSITVTEIECGLIHIFNGQPDPFITPVAITFTKQSAPILQSPAFGAKNQVVDELLFEWDGDGSDEYLLQIDTLDTFLDPVFEFEVSGAQQLVMSLENNYTYYWRVSRKDPYCTIGGWSEISKFTTGIRLEIFQHLIEETDPKVFRESVFSNDDGDPIVYQVAADGTPTMYIERNRGTVTIRDFVDGSYSGMLTESSEMGMKISVYEAPHVFEQDKVIYLDYWHEPGLQEPDLTLKLKIQPTPAIFVHDLFMTSGETWGPVHSYLSAAGWLNSYYADYDYNSADNFTQGSSGLQMAIESRLSAIRGFDQSGDFVNKVSLVGHGLGGLVIRHYLKTPGNEKNVSRLITLNTPHSGTPMANWILDADWGIGHWLSRKALAYAGATGNNGGELNPVNEGLMSIRTDSPQLLSLNASDVPVPAHAIATTTEAACQVEFAEAIATNLFLPPQAQFILYLVEATKELICEGDLMFNLNYCAIDFAIIQEGSDSFVGTSSQLGGLSAPSSTLMLDVGFDLLHFHTPFQPSVHSSITTVLEADSEGPSFSQIGFDPLMPEDVLDPQFDGLVLEDTIVEISILNVQNYDTLCSAVSPAISIEGNSFANRLMAIYFFGNDTIIIDTSHFAIHDFVLPNIPDYEGDVYIGILGTDGYGHFDFDTLSVYLTNGVPVEPQVSITADLMEICQGEEVTFSAAGQNEGTAPTYQWYVDGSLAAEGDPVFTTSDLTNGAEVYCTLLSNALCASPATVNSSPVSISVIPSVTPAVEIGASTNSVCAGEEVIFMAAASNEGSMPGFQWFKNGVPVGDNSPAYTSVFQVDGIEVYCELTSNAECADPTTVSSGSVTIAVTSLELPELALSQDTVFAVNYSGSEYGYAWYFNGELVSSDPFALCLAPGQFELIVTLNECLAANTIDVDACTVGAVDLEEMDRVALFPNPASQTVVVEGQIPAASDVSVALYNLLGQRVYEQRVAVVDRRFSTTLDLQGLPDGPYLVLVGAGHRSIGLKLLVSENGDH